MLQSRWYRHMILAIIVFLCCSLLYHLQTRLSLSHSFIRNTNRSSSNDSPKNDSNRHIAIILARQPSLKVLKHLNALVNVGINAFVMCDEQPSKYFNVLNGNLTNRLLYVSDENLAQYGLTRNRVWDRVFLWLYNQSWIDYAWLMEDDVTWVDVHQIVNLFNKYSRNQTDLLSRNIIYKNNETLGWIWWPQKLVDSFPEYKWSGSLNMLSRVSRRLINAHQYYTRQLLNETKHKNSTEIDHVRVYYQEFFIPTAARMFNLTMVMYDHSNMDVHVSALSEDQIRQSLSKGIKIFHPVKHDSQLLINATHD